MSGSQGPKDSCFEGGIYRLDEECSIQSDVLDGTMMGSGSLEKL
jgi:hypothetical protein